MTKKKFITIILTTLIVLVSCKEKNKKNADSQVTKVENKILENNIPSDSIPESHYYICYTFDKDKTKRILIEFDKNNKAIRLKYEGQKEYIILKYKKEEYVNGGAHPTIINYYDEIYNEKVNGEYIITHSGIWDYVKYLRGKDQKEFKYTIDHNSNPYSNKPCF